jgi:hypothetical protein
VAQLKSPRIQIIGEVLEINHAKKQARIKITQGIGIQEGVRLQVVEEGFDGGREVAQVVILEVKKTGEALVGPAKGDFQALDMGAQVQSDPNYRYRIAMGFFEDVEESDEKMIDVFLEKVYEEIGQSNRFESPDENVQSYAKEIKPSDRKQKMTQLFREGVDFYVDGEFTGSMGNRRLSATVWLTANGDKYQKIIIENTGF